MALGCLVRPGKQERRSSCAAGVEEQVRAAVQTGRVRHHVRPAALPDSPPACQDARSEGSTMLHLCLA